MAQKNFFQELQRVIAQNPSLPVVPMVHTDIVGGDESAYWSGKFSEVVVTEYFEVDGKAYFLDEGNIEDSIEAVHGRGYADSIPESRLVRVYAGLPWQKAVIVFIN